MKTLRACLTLYLIFCLSSFKIYPQTFIVPAPPPNTNAGIVPIVSTALESNHVLKASQGMLYSVYVVSTSATGFLMVFNATSAPADGAVTPTDCIPVSGNLGTINYIPGPPGLYNTGIVAVFSTGSSCYSKTASATAFFHAMVQ